MLVVNTCAFIEAAREESIGAVLELAGAKKQGATLTVTGCMAERYGQELADALPEVDLVAGFGVPVQFAGDRLGVTSERPLPSFDLLNLPRPPAHAPWAYVKVAEGCDRHCGFCAIPSFRGPQRSRSASDVLAEVDALDVAEVVLVAQDLVSWNRDVSARLRGRPRQSGPEVDRRPGNSPPGRAPASRAGQAALPVPFGPERTVHRGDRRERLPVFRSFPPARLRPLLRRMRRFGDGEKFVRKIELIRRRFPEAALRSSFIVGYPGETEEDHDALLRFLDDGAAGLGWFLRLLARGGHLCCGVAGPSSRRSLVAERLRECSELQDGITGRKRAGLVGTTCRALVDAPGTARSHREAPEIDGVVQVPASLPVGFLGRTGNSGRDRPGLGRHPGGRDSGERVTEATTAPPPEAEDGRQRGNGGPSGGDAAARPAGPARHTLVGRFAFLGGAGLQRFCGRLVGQAAAARVLRALSSTRSRTSSWCSVRWPLWPLSAR